MATKGDVDIAVKLRGAREFSADAGRVERSIKGIDTTTGKASGNVGALTGKTGKLKAAMATLGPMAAAAGGALVALGGAAVAKSINTTNDLAKSTMTLSRATNMSIEDASTFAAVAKVRGIGDKQMSMAMKSLAGQMVGYTDGVDGARKALDFFNVSQDTIAKGDFMGVLEEVAAGYDATSNAAERTTYMSKLFGRSWKELMPLFAQGAKSFREEMDMAGGLGSVFTDMDIKSWGELRKAQRGAQYASLGLQVALGKKLIPMMAKAGAAVNKFLGNWVKNRGTAGDIKKVFQDVGPVIGQVFKGLWKAGSALSRAWRNSKALRTAMKSAFDLLPVASAISLLTRLVGVIGNVKKGFNSVKGAFRSAAGVLKSAFNGAVNFVKSLFQRLKFTLTIPSALRRFVPGPDSFTINFVPGLADGGTITRSGVAMVGERGPELLRLPRGAQVQPLTNGAGFGGTVVTKVYLDRRQIAEAVGSEVSSRAARR